MDICIYGEENCFLKWRAIIKDNYNGEVKCFWCTSISNLTDCLLQKDVIGLIFELQTVDDLKIQELNQCTKFIRHHCLDVEVAVINASSSEAVVSRIAHTGYRIKNSQDSVGVQALLKLLDRAIGRRTGGCHSDSGERLAKLEVQLEHLFSEVVALKQEIKELDESLYGSQHTTGFDTKFDSCLKQLASIQQEWVTFENQISEKVLDRVFQGIARSLWEWSKNNWAMILGGISAIFATVISILKFLK